MGALLCLLHTFDGNLKLPPPHQMKSLFLKNGKKIFANHVSGKRLAFGIYKEFSKLNSEKIIIIQLENEQQTRGDTPPIGEPDDQEVHEKMLNGSATGE